MSYDYSENILVQESAETSSVMCLVGMSYLLRFDENLKLFIAYIIDERIEYFGS